VADGVSPEGAATALQFLFAGVAADTVGILLTLVWTAGFLPSFLDAGAVSVLLAKPAPRTALFLGRWLGVLLFVTLQATVFVAATWLALGVSTGAWPAAYWLCVPLLLAHFAAFSGFAAVLAVATRSTAACVIGSLLFWALCWAMNFGRHVLASIKLDEA